MDVNGKKWNKIFSLPEDGPGFCGAGGEGGWEAAWLAHRYSCISSKMPFQVALRHGPLVLLGSKVKL